MSDFFGKERRRVERTYLTPGAPLSMQLILPGERLLAGEIRDISASGAAVSFSLSDCPALDRGETIRVILIVEQPERAVRLEASVIESIVQGRQRFCRLDLSIPDDFLVGLDPTIQSWLNRRSGVRVDTHEIEVKLAWSEGSCAGRMMNLSLTGCCVGLPPAAVSKIDPFTQVSFSFRIPGDDALVEVNGRIVNSREEDGTMLCGVDFETDLTGSAYEQGEAIYSFLSEQCEL